MPLLKQTSATSFPVTFLVARFAEIVRLFALVNAKVSLDLCPEDDVKFSKCPWSTCDLEDVNMRIQAFSRGLNEEIQWGQTQSRYLEKAVQNVASLSGWAA
jgi:hypothetical protein